MAGEDRTNRRQKAQLITEGIVRDVKGFTHGILNSCQGYPGVKAASRITCSWGLEHGAKEGFADGVGILGTE